MQWVHPVKKPTVTERQGSHTSWKVLDFFLENFRPGKSWKNILENYTFFIGYNGKQAEIVCVPVCVDFYFTYFWHYNQHFTSWLQFLQWTIFRMSWVKGVFSLYLSIPGLRKGPGKFPMGVLESPGKVPDFFSSERVGSLERIHATHSIECTEMVCTKTFLCWSSIDGWVCMYRNCSLVSHALLTNPNWPKLQVRAVIFENYLMKFGVL